MELTDSEIQQVLAEDRATAHRPDEVRRVQDQTEFEQFLRDAIGDEQTRQAQRKSISAARELIEFATHGQHHRSKPLVEAITSLLDLLERDLKEGN